MKKNIGILGATLLTGGLTFDEPKTMEITNPYKDLDMDFAYNPNGRTQNTNRQPKKKKKRKRKGKR